MYLSYDPGKTTGWARFNDDGSAVEYGQVSLDDLIDHLDAMEKLHETDPVRTIIVEDFTLFSRMAKQQAGSKMEASQAIGMLKAFAARCGPTTLFVLQDPKIKAVAEKLTQLSPKGMAHSRTHWIDAFNHGAYYLINAGIRQTQLEMDNDNKSKDR